MAPEDKRAIRSVRPAEAAEPGYPSIGEHLTSRRELLTFVGASLAGVAVSACVISSTNGMPAPPQYNTFRLPEVGELEATLASGEPVRFYVNGVYYGDDRSSFAVEEELCVDVLGEQTADTLATADGRLGVEQALFDTLDPHFEDLSSVALTIVSP